MDKLEAQRVAEKAAWTHGYMHSYVTPEFIPHARVIRAVQAAYDAGYRDACNDHADTFDEVED